MTHLPYSEATESNEAFSFEGFIESSEHDNYVWTNSYFIIALLLMPIKSKSFQTERRPSWRQ
jgi:predicted component of type VI protein secretion system